MTSTYGAKVLADSRSASGARLTTLEVTFPRIILAEINTHRVFSRNSASSRAIPIEKMIDKAINDPYIPHKWGKNCAGMASKEDVTPETASLSQDEWLRLRDEAVSTARALAKYGVHKEWSNRVLEPFMWHVAIISSTEWGNFLNLRLHSQAHPAIRETASAMCLALAKSKPVLLWPGEWHTPLVPDRAELYEDFLQGRFPSGNTFADVVKKVSAGRCARVSYLTHDGKRDPVKDFELCDKLLLDGHMSPVEHVATPLESADEWCGNFRGWRQFRKTIAGESDPRLYRAEGVK